MVPSNILLNNWESDWFAERQHADVLLTQAYQAGADAELEACCDWMSECTVGCPNELRAVRRPKPSSLKEQALAALNEADQGLNESEWRQRSDTIRRALEALPDD
jgi:hypothetical protein